MGHVDDKPMTRWQRFKDNDIVWSFLSSPGAMIAAAVASVMISACIFAPVIAPFDPFDPAQISLWDGKLPPAWVDGGQSKYLLGTDNQGRDMISTILYGGRLSILVGLAAVCLGMVLGVFLGVIAGYLGGATDAVIMRLADVQLTIPGILLAILINGIPPTTPSLGTLIRVGNEYLFSGLWWITLFPAVALIVLVFSVNLLGDWLRDALNPKLR